MGITGALADLFAKIADYLTISYRQRWYALICKTIDLSLNP